MCCRHTEIPFNAFGGVMKIGRQGHLKMEKLFKSLCLDKVTWQHHHGDISVDGPGTSRVKDYRQEVIQEESEM